MTLDSVHVRAPHRPTDLQSQSSTPSPRRQNHKRDRSQTLGTTFVSTAVVPAPSSTDVLSSLISSLTLLSDSAREQLRSARDPESTSADPTTELVHPAFTPAVEEQEPFAIFNSSTEPQNLGIEDSDGDEAEPPVVGYARSKSRDQKRPSLKELKVGHGLAKERSINSGRSGSSHTMRALSSGAPSGIGVPSIERGYTGSTSSLPMSFPNGARSPLKMFFPSRQDDDSNQSIRSSSRDPEVKSIRSLRTMKSKHSVTTTHEPEKELHPPNVIAFPEEQPTVTTVEKFTPEHKAYSPLSPAHRDDLGEHLIPSRRSSIRHSPSLRSPSKGRSPSTGRASNLRTKSFSAVDPDVPPSPELGEEPFEEEDSTLRRIRELQQAKEKRHLELRKESRRSERSTGRSSRNHPKPAVISSPEMGSAYDPDLVERVDHTSLKGAIAMDKFDSESLSATVIREIDATSPPPNTTPAMPSPALSTPRKHKRSLSTGLRRSNSSKRPVDELRNVSEQVEAFLSAPRLTQRIRHPRTGRTITFSEVGDPNGFTVFCCVGMGLTRYVTSFYDDIARTQKLRLITPDRPGIGESSPFPDNVCTPLAWVDDVAIICQTLNIEKFSLLAHSAGSIYALATALKMPDRVRGRIHLLAPWIPPSQFPNSGVHGDMKAVNLPIAHKILSVLPAPFLKAANSRFLSATSASIEPRSGRSWKKDRSISSNYDALLAEMSADIQPSNLAPDTASLRHSSFSFYANTPGSTPSPYNYRNGIASTPSSPSPTNMKRQVSSSVRKFRSPTPNEGSISLTPQAKQALFNTELTHRTWALATLNANPAVDLLVCLERRRPIGFKYTDVMRGVVVHHGREDARVPLENVQWLSDSMKRCELRVLDNEGHGLMASASVMSKVLCEIGREWEEWAVVAKENEKKRKDEETAKERTKELERRRFIRHGH